MSKNDLLALWPKLTRSAQYALLKQAKLLAERHSGTIELHCHEGGVRMVKVGHEFHFNDKGGEGTPRDGT